MAKVVKKGSRTSIKLPELPKNTYSKNNQLLNEDRVRDLASIQCTMIEIAACCKCSVDTLENRFSDIIKEARESGKQSLRRAQYQKAIEGNPTMLIWCGKHILNQREVVEVSTHKSDVEIVLDRLKSMSTEAVDTESDIEENS